MGCTARDKPIRHRKPRPSKRPPPPSGYCTEDQLEELLLRNIDLVYTSALSKLHSLGYSPDLALSAVLRNGHCYGTMDVLTNVVHNALKSLSPSPSSSDDDDANLSLSPSPSPARSAFSFSDLRQLEEYSLAGMVCLLQEVRPELSRGDAMWCLLMSDLNVSRARSVEVPAVGDGKVCAVREKEVGRRFDLPVSMKSFLKRNVVASATIRTRNVSRTEVGRKEADVVGSVLKRLESMKIEEDEEENEDKDAGEDQRKEMILGLVHQIRDLEEQVRERKEWAQQKAMQAAQKLSSDLTELKILRMEREENQRLKKGKQTLEDSTMKRLSEMENALRKASGQVDRANAAVRQLEAENAEIRAEMEACKLSAAESVKACLEVTKREKKCLKRLLAWEKQKQTLQDEIVEEKKKVLQMQQKLRELKEEQIKSEAQWKQEVEAKDKAIVQLEEERRAKEAAEVRIKRGQEALRQKIEIDFQRHKDDFQRLEQELSRLRSVELAQSNRNPVDKDGTKVHKGAGAKASIGSIKLQDSSPVQARHGRKCVICLKDEVSVVFLPCAHQVLCIKCNEDHTKKAKACPCCNMRVEERIRVYGASS